MWNIWCLVVKNNTVIIAMLNVVMNTFGIKIKFCHWWCLTHLKPLTSFYPPWKHQKTRCFLTFPGGWNQWHKIRFIIKKDTTMVFFLKNVLKLVLTVSEKCPNTDQKKLRIRTLFTQRENTHKWLFSKNVFCLSSLTPAFCIESLNPAGLVTFTEKKL